MRGPVLRRDAEQNRQPTLTAAQEVFAERVVGSWAGFGR